MLICEDLPLLQKTLWALLDQLQQRRWAVNPQKIKGPSTAIKLLGIVWPIRSMIIPEATIDTMQAYPIPKNAKEVQAFAGVLGCWRTLIPHLVQCLHPDSYTE